MNDEQDPQVDQRIANYPLDQFLSLSEALTGFDKVELLGTGMAQQYYEGP